MSESGSVAAQLESHALEPPQAEVQQLRALGDEREVASADVRPKRRLRDVLRRVLGSGRLDVPPDVWARTTLSMPELLFGARNEAAIAPPRSVEAAPPKRTRSAGEGTRAHGPLVAGPPPRLAGSGQRADVRIRERVEQATNNDLDDVRVHTDTAASDLAAELHARAFTVGRDIYFAAGEYAPGTRSGDELLAHELAHTVQHGEARVDSQLMPVSDPDDGTEREARSFARDVRSGKTHAGSHTLSRHGAAAVLHRDGPKVDAKAEEEKVLRELFGVEGLAAVRKEINANAEAKKLTTERGAVAYLALVDTREDGKLAPAKARAALDADAKNQSKYALRLMRARPEAGKRLWFHELPAPTKPDEPVTMAREEEEVFVESRENMNTGKLRTASVKGVGEVAVRFAYQKREMRGDHRSEDATKAEDIVLSAIGRVLGELASQASDKKQTKETREFATRLRDSLLQYTQGHPLNVYLAETTVSEMISGGRKLETDRVYINENDVGDPTKLEAAIRMPFTAMLGGVVGMADVKALTSPEMDEGALHELIHAELLRQGAAASQMWDQIASTVAVQGAPTMQSRGTELIRMALLAQEEAFVYGEVARLGGTYETRKDQGAFMANWSQLAKAFFMSKGASIESVTKSLAPRQRQKKEKKAKASSGTWSITYEYPRTLTLDASDLTSVNGLIGSYLR